ncbi:hypothetical protein [Neptunicoccus sediminis]|uniref:hypothetical protein n=1 Tax=Neptunicoccus sediminis TaxID=1892596 RepID=UPI0008460F77|nr:hypothetical protein [Neptunicoccus sediminis]
MATLASLDIAIGADSARLKRDLDKANKNTKKFANTAKKNIDKVSKSFRAVGAAMAGIAAAAGVKSLLENADALGKSAKAAGISVDAYQRLRFGLEQAGVSQSAFEKSTLKMNKVMLDASRGSKTATDALSRIGLTFAELDRMKPEDRYTAVLTALQGVGDKGEKAALSVELLGKEFGNRDVDVAGMVAAGESLNVLSEEAVNASAGVNDAFNLIGTNFRNLLSNALIPLIDNLTPVFNSISKFSADNPMMASAIVGTGLLTVAVGALGLAFSVLSWPILAVTAAVAGLVGIWANFDTIVRASDAYLGENFGYTLSGIIEKVSSLASWVVEYLTPAFKILIEFVKASSTIVGNFFGILKDVYNLDFASAGERMKNSFSAVATFFGNIFGDAISNLVENTKAQFSWAFSAVAVTFSNLFGKVVNAILKPIETTVNNLIAAYNSVTRSDLSGITIAGFKPQEIPSAPEWKKVTTNLGQTTGTGLGTDGRLIPNTDLGRDTGTGLTSAILPTTPTTPTTPDSGFGTGTGSGSGSGSGSSSGAGTVAGEEEEVNSAFVGSLKTGLAEALKTGDWKEFLEDTFDNFTNRIVDEFASGMVDGLLAGLGLDEEGIESWFEQFSGSGAKLGEKITDGFDGVNVEGSTNGFFGKLTSAFSSGLSMAGDFLSSAFEGLMSSFGGGSGGGLGGIGAFIGTIFGASEGGIVGDKPTPFKRMKINGINTNRDHQPYLLEAGELVVPKDEVGGFLNNEGTSSQTVNFNITGDISRQTESEILKLAPTITEMVNRNNKERGIA